MEPKELRQGNLIYTPDGVIDSVTDIAMDGCVMTLLFGQMYDLEPISLTEEWLIKFGFENWGKGGLYSNEYETYDRFVLHNVLDGTSNFEVHYILSTYGNTHHKQFIISSDEDDRISWGVEIKYVHQLQNLYFALTGEELELKEDSK